MMPRPYDTYQYLGDGQEYHWKNEREKDSRFWNDGRWESFVKPYLPDEASDMTLVDVGCNAGLFVKLAKDLSPYPLRNLPEAAQKLCRSLRLLVSTC